MSNLFLTKEQWIKVAKGAGLAAGAAVCTYLLEAIPGMNLGQYAVIVTAVVSVLLNIIRKAVI